MKRAFARRVNVRVARLHREKFAAILKHEAESGNNDAAAHPAIIALNQANHVALIIGGTEVNRVALIQRRISRIHMFVRAIRIDQLASLSCIAFRKQTGQRNFCEGGISIKFRTIGPDNFLRFDHRVQRVG